MPSPSNLGDLGHQIAVLPASTATTAWLDQQTAADTGTIVATGRVLDFGLNIGVGSTGAKTLDGTVNPLAVGPLRQYHSVTIALPLQLYFADSGDYVFFSIAHQQRSATSGAGSTWATVKTDAGPHTKFRMGTSTEATFFHGVASSVNTQALQRYYRAQVTMTRRLGTDTGAQDTTTGSTQLCVGPSYILSGANEFPAQE